ncbi:MAG TPA: helical backbone metal receptor [Dehalococcoidia bacterium]|nr:helical backbone metal receptor [Dehalococcoidia bacterium]
MTWTDALGEQVTLTRPPRRIVSLVPSITETLFAFGLQKRIVGVTKFCIEPAGDVESVPKVGGTKDVDVEAVKALKPDFVVANVEENEQPDIEALREAGIPVFVTYPRSIAAASAMMRTLADILGCEKAASPQIAAVDAAAALTRSRNRERTPVSVFCPIWRKPWMTINSDTYVHDFLITCGLHNVFADSRDRYPAIGFLDVEERKPEIAILPDEPFPFKERHIAEITSAIPILTAERIYLVDGKDICWYGPRIAGALRRMQALLWGEI